MNIFTKNKSKSNNDNGAPSRGKEKRPTPVWVSDLRYGRSVSVDFFRKNAWILMVFVVAIISLMGLRYKTKTKMEEIKKLTTELHRAESSKLQEKAAYMSLIRETEMKRLVEERGLGLTFQEMPPYELVLENE